MNNSAEWRPKDWKEILNSIVTEWCKSLDCDDFDSWISCDCEMRDDFTDGVEAGASAMLRTRDKWWIEPCGHTIEQVDDDGCPYDHPFQHRYECTQCINKVKQSPNAELKGES